MNSKEIFILRPDGDLIAQYYYVLSFFCWTDRNILSACKLVGIFQYCTVLLYAKVVWNDFGLICEVSCHSVYCFYVIFLNMKIVFYEKVCSPFRSRAVFFQCKDKQSHQTYLIYHHCLQTVQVQWKVLAIYDSIPNIMHQGSR